jgi:leader peptidase (prepilin peptidase)/N-methyltransferase
MTIVIGAMLFVAGIIDIATRQISRGFIAIFLMTCLVAAWLDGDTDIVAAACGMLPGICALGISMASKEQIGRGDGLVILCLGIFLGFRGCFIVVCVASVFMCMVSIIVLALRLGSRSTRLPYIPSLFAGYAVYAASLIGWGM